MPAILLTPPAIEPVSLVEAKAHLKVEVSDDDSLIDGLITTARQHIECQTGKALIDQTWAIYLDDWGGNEIVLPVEPVSAVNAIRTYSEDDSAPLIGPEHYYTDTVSSPARIVLRGSRVWQRPGRIANGIEIELVAGYGPAGNDVPASLRQAILLLVAHWYENREGASYGNVAHRLPLGIDRLIRPYCPVRL